MSTNITQMRLALRLEGYLSDFLKKNSRIGTLTREAWDLTWQVADAARINNVLTPELVDDVRIALYKL